MLRETTMSDGVIMRKDKKLKADLVVIGGGGAGLAVVFAAAEKGAQVIVLKKRNCTGGIPLWLQCFRRREPGSETGNDRCVKRRAV